MNTEIIWACNFGHPLRLERGEDRGEVSNPGNQKTAVNNNLHQFPHRASPPWRDEVKRKRLIPAEFALPRGRECCACLRRPRSRVFPRGDTKTAAGRRQMERTRQNNLSERTNL